MGSLLLYALFIGGTSIERLIEMVVSRSNAKWSFQQGGHEVGQGHFPAMVLLHTCFLISCPLEVYLLKQPFIPALGWTMLGLAICTQGLRWWCILTLGKRWNTRVIIVPGLKRITNGPYRFMNHPNYLAVVLEGIALPLIHSAWLTAISFTLLNAWLLTIRLRCEEEALQSILLDKPYAN